MSAEYNATVTMCFNLTSETRLLRVKLDGEPFDYEAGQYTVLGLQRSTSRIAEATEDSPELKKKPHDFLIRRAYSITSNSKDRELEFVVTLVRSGSLTPRLFNLKEGDRLFVEPKASGAFTMQASSGNRDLLLVATGTALAPYVSMIRTDFPQDTQTRYVVVHAAAVSWDLAFRAQMEALTAQAQHLTYLPTITDPGRDANWHGLVGPVEQLLRAGEIEDAIGMPLSPDRFDVFLAGNPEMIDQVTAELESRGFQAGDLKDPDTTIRCERYW